MWLSPSLSLDASCWKTGSYLGHPLCNCPWVTATGYGLSGQFKFELNIPQNRMKYLTSSPTKRKPPQQLMLTFSYWAFSISILLKVDLSICDSSVSSLMNFSILQQAFITISEHGQSFSNYICYSNSYFTGLSSWTYSTGLAHLTLFFLTAPYGDPGYFMQLSIPLLSSPAHISNDD